MEACFVLRRNGRAGSQNNVLFSSFFNAKIAEILALYIYLLITKLFQSSLSKKHGIITNFLKRLQIV